MTYSCSGSYSAHSVICRIASLKSKYTFNKRDQIVNDRLLFLTLVFVFNLDDCMRGKYEKRLPDRDVELFQLAGRAEVVQLGLVGKAVDLDERGGAAGI